MKLIVTIEMDNAAFEADALAEAARILAGLAGQMAAQGDGELAGLDFGELMIGTLRDQNGNACGQWEISQ
jgi:hypothetical protein